MSEPAVVLVATQAALALNSLTPYHLKGQGRPFPPDGLQLFRVLTGRHVDASGPVHAALLRPLLAPGAPVPPPSRHLPEIAFQVGRPDRLREGWAARDAQDDMRALLTAPDLPRAEGTFVLTFLVANELAFGRTGTTASDLEAWSAEALARMPSPHTRVLRGGALVALGRPAEARSMILPAVEGDLVEADRLFARAFLGQAAAALGEAEAARRWFAEARALPVAKVGALPRVLDRWEASLPRPAPAAGSGVPRARLRASRDG